MSGLETRRRRNKYYHMDLTLFTDGIKALYAAPSWLLLALVVNVIGLLLKSQGWIPNKRIPLICVAIGAILFPFVGSVDGITPAPRYPMVTLAEMGMIISLGAWLLHGLLLKRFEKFLPAWVLEDEKPEVKPPTDPKV